MGAPTIIAHLRPWPWRGYTAIDMTSPENGHRDSLKHQAALLHVAWTIRAIPVKNHVDVQESGTRPTDAVTASAPASKRLRRLEQPVLHISGGTASTWIASVRVTLVLCSCGCRAVTRTSPLVRQCHIGSIRSLRSFLTERLRGNWHIPTRPKKPK